MLDFLLPEGLIGRFAIVKLWPGTKTAEDECIARLKNAAAALNLECLAIHADGRFVENPNVTITKKDVDFVVHLHYDTPKLYDAFSFVALWNPIQFYHQWGYARCSRNLLSHDDFVSCSSDVADHHVGRLIRNSAVHLPPYFTLYHSVADIVYPPSLGDHKLFYIGINWEALGGGNGRHQALLKSLDDSGVLRIYGPTIFQGVKVWKGYKSYVRELPFDGTSITKEIANAGIALVLSSEAHKQSELMSNRLFESIAAGALVICDENNFAKKFFGESLLYIDTRWNVQETHAAILAHLDWARNNPQKALAMIANAQQLFRDKFSLKKNLQDLYQNFSQRKQNLLNKDLAEFAENSQVNLTLLMPEFSEAVLETHIASVSVQEYPFFSPTLVIDKSAAIQNHDPIKSALAKSSIPINILEVDFFNPNTQQEIKQRRKLGEVIFEILEKIPKQDAIVFVAPNEKLFSNHLQVLAANLARNTQVACAATSAIMKRPLNVMHGNHEKIDFSDWEKKFPIGYARFIFRMSALSKDLNLALPYLDRKVMAVLVGDNKIYQEIPATVVIDTANPFPVGFWDEEQENALISSFCPSALTAVYGYEIKLPASSKKITKMQKNTQIIKWILAQLRILRHQGLAARIVAFKRKFNLV